MSFKRTLTRADQNTADEVLKVKESIMVLKNQLIKIGYNPGEVDYMVKKFGHGKSLNELDMPDLLEIRKTLQTQLEIAKKCLEAI